MNKVFTLLTLCISFSISAESNRNKPTTPSAVYQMLEQLADPNIGIGHRVAGTEQEKQTAKFISNQFSSYGYQVTNQAFTFKMEGKTLDSINVIADLTKEDKPTIILAAHYDTTGVKVGSMGAADNGAGVAAMLIIAKRLINEFKGSYNIRFIAFGAEEGGLHGSKFYVQQLSANETTNIIGMINFDTVAGGDYVYVHSAHSKPYKCPADSNYNYEPVMRDALLSASVNALSAKDKYLVHPEYAGYPEGETGSWSDHAAFACAGIPIAYVEATNFEINGQEGNDGYSQTVHPKVWDCFESYNLTACDRHKEKRWGKIWHTEFDDLDKLNRLFPGRIEKQLNDNVKVLTEFLTEPDKYLKQP